MGQRYQTLPIEKFVEKLRRADCLFTLIGAWHGGEPEDTWKHGSDLVGRRVLIDVLQELKEGKTCRLSKYARLDDSADRYFMNRLGGLGQYYLGSLRELQVLEGDAKSSVKYTKERGGVLAETFNEGVSLKKFFDAIEEDRITLSTLKSLKAFCPCGLTSNPEEQGTLTDLFFNRPGAFFEEDGQERRQTLTLFLDLIAGIEGLSSSHYPEVTNEWLFRACAYTSALPNGKTWSAPGTFEQVRKGWMIYQRNELLSVAVQGIFWAALKELEGQGGFIESRQDFQDLFVSTFEKEALGNMRRKTFAAAVDGAGKRIPKLADWQDESHEIQLAWKLVDEAHQSPDEKVRVRVIHLAIEILLSLAARSADEVDPYGGFVNEVDLTDYPINLFTFREFSNGLWREMHMADLLGWLATEWGLDVHFRVSLRKLRGEGKDTFRIRPIDGGLEVIDAPLPEFSNPRLRQAYHILCDLGAMERDSETEKLSLTELGRSLLEECRG